MAWKLNMVLQDSKGRRKQKSFELKAADYASAKTAEAAIAASVAGISVGGVVSTAVVEVTDVSEAPVSGSNIDTGLTMSFSLPTLGKRGTVKIPMPIDSVFVTGTPDLDLANALVLAVEADIVTYCNISDGEAPVDLIKGVLDS